MIKVICVRIHNEFRDYNEMDDRVDGDGVDDDEGGGYQCRGLRAQVNCVVDSLLSIPLRIHSGGEVSGIVLYGGVSLFVISQIQLHRVEVVDQEKAAACGTTLLF